MGDTDPNLEVLNYFDGVLSLLEDTILSDPPLAHRIIVRYQAHHSRVRAAYKRMAPLPPAVSRVRPPFQRCSRRRTLEPPGQREEP